MSLKLNNRNFEEKTINVYRVNVIITSNVIITKDIILI